MRKAASEIAVPQWLDYQMWQSELLLTWRVQLCSDARSFLLMSREGGDFGSIQTSNFPALLESSFDVEFVSIEAGSDHGSPEVGLTMVAPVVKVSIAIFEYCPGSLFNISDVLPQREGH
jgi:hypothetical protein